MPSLLQIFSYIFPGSIINYKQGRGSGSHVNEILPNFYPHGRLADPDLAPDLFYKEKTALVPLLFQRLRLFVFILVAGQIRILMESLILIFMKAISQHKQFTGIMQFIDYGKIG